jgi:hypothetical protein
MVHRQGPAPRTARLARPAGETVGTPADRSGQDYLPAKERLEKQLLSVSTAAQRSDGVSEKRPCYLSDQLSVRTYCCGCSWGVAGRVCGESE